MTEEASQSRCDQRFSLAVSQVPKRRVCFQPVPIRTQKNKLSHRHKIDLTICQSLVGSYVFGLAFGDAQRCPFLHLERLRKFAKLFC